MSGGHLLRRNAKQAKAHFRSVAASYPRMLPDYAVARAELRRMSVWRSRQRRMVNVRRLRSRLTAGALSQRRFPSLCRPCAEHEGDFIRAVAQCDRRSGSLRPPPTPMARGRTWHGGACSISPSPTLTPRSRSPEGAVAYNNRGNVRRDRATAVTSTAPSSTSTRRCGSIPLRGRPAAAARPRCQGRSRTRPRRLHGVLRLQRQASPVAARRPRGSPAASSLRWRAPAHQRIGRRRLSDALPLPGARAAPVADAAELAAHAAQVRNKAWPYPLIDFFSANARRRTRWRRRRSNRRRISKRISMSRVASPAGRSRRREGPLASRGGTMPPEWPNTPSRVELAPAPAVVVTGRCRARDTSLMIRANRPKPPLPGQISFRTLP